MFRHIKYINSNGYAEIMETALSVVKRLPQQILNGPS